MPNPDTLQRLRSGEVIIETIRSDESGGAARFMVFMDTDVESIWEIIFSCERAFIFVKGLKVCEVLEDDGLHSVVHQVVKTSWLVPRQDFTFRTLREPFRRVEFARIEGKPKVMEGSWDFISLPQGVVVIHEIRVQPDLPVPRFIVRHLMRKSMPEMLGCMRSLAGGSVSTAQQEQDFNFCPGKPK